MSRRILLAACLSLLAVFSCGSHKKPAATVPKIDAPDWYTHPERDNDRLIGVATATSRDLQTAVDKVSPGVRQCDAVADILSAQTRGTAEYGGDYASIVPLLSISVVVAAGVSVSENPPDRARPGSSLSMLS